MHIFLHRFCAFVALGIALSIPALVNAATNVDWTGATNTNFETGTNWSGNAAPANDTTTNIAHFTGSVTANQPQITVSRSVNGLLFDTAGGGWTLSSSSTSNILTVGVGGISTIGQTGGTDIISANLNPNISQIWVAGSGGTLQIDGTVSLTASRTISVGTPGNTGIVIFNGTNTNFLGTLAVITGSFGIGNNSALGTGALSLGGTNSNTPTIFASGGARTISNNITLLATAGGGNATISGSDALTLNGTLTNSGAGRTLSVNNSATTTIGGNVFLSEAAGTGRTLTINGTGDATVSGVIANFNGTGTAGNLIKSGINTLTLTNSNTYTGTTQVTGGTLIINGNQSSANGAVSVSNSGSVLGGIGTIGGATTINANGTITGGTKGSGNTIVSGNIGALTLNNNLTFTGSSGNPATYLVDIANGANNSDKLTIGGILDLNNAFDQISFNGTPDGTSSYLLASATGGIQGTFSLGSAPTGYQFIYSTNNLTLAPIPEPSTWMAGALALMVIGYSLQRRVAAQRAKR